jgi:hypothetical protein
MSEPTADAWAAFAETPTERQRYLEYAGQILGNAIIRAYKDHILQTKAARAEWQAKIDNASPRTTDAELEAWRAEVRECDRLIRIGERRIRAARDAGAAE